MGSQKPLDIGSQFGVAAGVIEKTRALCNR